MPARPLPGWVVVVVLLGVMAYAVAEDLTLTTYYPAPRGVYEAVRVTKELSLGTTVSHGLVTVAGETVHTEFGACPAGYDFYDEDGDGSPDYEGECKRTGLVVQADGHVGIGTTTPAERLEVNGHIKLSGATPTYRITNVLSPPSGLSPVNDADVATKAYVDAQAGGGSKVVTAFSGNLGSTTPNAATLDCGEGWVIGKCVIGINDTGSAQWPLAKQAALDAYHGNGHEAGMGTAPGTDAFPCDWDLYGNSRSVTVPVPYPRGVAIIAECVKSSQ